MKIEKYLLNPILTKEDVPICVNSIFNPGAIKFNNEYLLLCRIEMPIGRSSFIIARSKDGINFKVDEKPCLTPEDHKEYYQYVEWGIEDPRITIIDGKFKITYTGYSRLMPVVMLAETEDFNGFRLFGPISEPVNKDCAIFPEKIDGVYWRMDRPSSEHTGDIWLSKSPDLVHWGGYRHLMGPVPGSWETDKVGGSTPPVKTDKGWLCLYHGVRSFGISTLYKISVMLMDLKEPWKVIGRSSIPFLFPEHSHERIGEVENVIFSNGWIIEEDGSVKIYYSGADTNICLAQTNLDYLLSLCS